ncbi:MAG TPA: hypothetical protein VJ103_00805 [Candidatus Paceibacterota bacterium]|nr:hypothetical protein [Candidatus Paceibacterota bacterium]
MATAKLDLSNRSLAIDNITPESCDVNGPGLQIEIFGQQGSGFLAEDTKIYMVNDGAKIPLDTLVINGQGAKADMKAEFLRAESLLKIMACIVDEAGKIVKEGNQFPFPIGTPMPEIASTLPEKILDDSDQNPAKVIINGKRFVRNSQLLINNTFILAPTYRNDCRLEFEVPKQYRKRGKKIQIEVINPGTNAKKSNAKIITVVGPDEWDDNAQVLPTQAQLVVDQAKEETKKEKKEKEKWKFWSIVESGIIIISIIIHLWGLNHKPEEPAKEEVEQDSTQPIAPVPANEVDANVKGICIVPQMQVGQVEELVITEKRPRVVIQCSSSREKYIYGLSEEVLWVNSDGSVRDTLYPPENLPAGKTNPELVGNNIYLEANRYLGPGSLAVVTVTRTK